MARRGRQIGHGGASSRPPLVGRDAERARLLGALDAVGGGQLRAVLLEGEPGIGKSRLADEVVDEAGRRGFGLAIGRAEQLAQARPFGAIADVLDHDAPRTVAGTDAEATLRTLLAVDPAAPDHHLVDAFLDAVEAWAVEGPVVVVLEDLHWADAATLAAAGAVIRRLTYLPVLLLGSFRPHPFPEHLATFVEAVGRAGGDVVTLGPLDGDEVHALTRALLDADPGTRLARALTSTGGNPLNVVELVSALRDEGTIAVVDGVADTETEVLPPSLRVTVLRRLAFLPTGTLSALRFAAVLGSTFAVEPLAAAVRRSVHDLALLLEPARRAGVVGDHGEALRFRHDLIREAIYDDIPPPLRASMHAEVVRALRSVQAPLAQVAEHLLRAPRTGVPDLVETCVEVAETMAERSPATAVALYEHILGMLDDDDDPRADDVRRLLLGPLTQQGRPHDAVRLADRLLERAPGPETAGAIALARADALLVAGRPGDAVATWNALLDDGSTPPGLRERASIALGVSHLLTGQPGLARGAALRALETTEPAPHLRPLTLFVLGMAELFEGHSPAAAEHLTRALEIDPDLRSPILTPYACLATMLLQSDRVDDALDAVAEGRRRAQAAGAVNELAPLAGVASAVAFLTGRWDDAVAEAETSLALSAEGTGSSGLGLAAYSMVGAVASRRGERAEARRLVDDAYEFARTSGVAMGIECVGWVDAMLRADDGDTVGALETIWGFWELTAPVRYAFSWRFLAPDVVRLAVAAGDAERTASVVVAADEGSKRAGGLASAEAAALRCRGLAADDPELLLAAVEASSETAIFYDRAGACADAAASLARHGREGDARRLFGEALGFYESAAADAEVARLTAQMQSFGLARRAARPRRPRFGWGALTPTELEVVRLAAAGFTNPQIAERLFVSKYTVMTHLSHVFTKLEISSRVELAAEAVRAGVG